MRMMIAAWLLALPVWAEAVKDEPSYSATAQFDEV